MIAEKPIADLLAELAVADVRLAVAGIRLRIDAPAGTITPVLMARIREIKAGLINAIRLAGPCEACRGVAFVDHALTAGRGTRRDCSRCGHTWGFTSWTPAGKAPFVEETPGEPCEAGGES